MEHEQLVSIQELSSHYQTHISFINSLQEYDLIDVTSHDGNRYIHHDELQKLEKLVRLHYELEINLEGIDVIQNLLQRIEAMQQEIIALRNRIGTDLNDEPNPY